MMNLHFEAAIVPLGEHAGSEAAGVSLEGASPGVLRDLHRDLVRHLRGRALLWIGGLAVLAVPTAWLLASGAGSFSSLLLVAGLTAVQAGRALTEWRAAARVDPVAGAVRLTAEIEQERAKRIAFNERLLRATPVVTTILASLIVAITLVEFVAAGTVGRAVARAGLVKFLVADGEWWRLISSTFLHANLVHLASNVFALLIFSRIIEAFVPRPWLLATYIASGIAGSLASWALSPETHSIGASGAVMGVVAFAAVLVWRRPDAFPQSVRHRGWIVILLTLYVGALADSRIDNAAHLGGALAGAAIAIAALRRSGEARAHPGGLATLAVLSVVLLVGGAVRTVMALTGPAGPSPAAAASAASRPVTLVSADVVRERGALYVIVTNHGPADLEAYEIDVANVFRIWRDDCCLDSANRRRIEPGGVHRIPVGTPPRGFRLRGQAVVTGALFADGSFEGAAAVREAIQARREYVRDEATFWIDLLDRAPARSVAETTAYLERYVPIRASLSEHGPPALEALEVPLLVLTGQRRPATFSTEVARVRSRMAAARDALGARLGPGFRR